MFWQSSHLTFEQNVVSSGRDFTCKLLSSCEVKSTNPSDSVKTNSGCRTCLPDPFKRRKCGGCPSQRPWCHGRCVPAANRCLFGGCSNSPYREEIGKTCSLQALDLAESEDECKEQCTDNNSGTCQACIEEKLNIDSPECLKLSSLECFHCIRPVMLDSIECSSSNTNPEDIIQCIHGKQETSDCKKCVCSILCYVNAEGGLCRECLQNSNLETYFSNYDKCDQSWTWSKQNSKCYKAFATPRPWRLASRFCQNGGARLVEPKVDSSIQLVLEAIDVQATSGKYWIGGKSEDGATFTWTGDNSIVNNDNDNWAFGFPISG